MTCHDCGEDTLFDGVCIDCSDRRFNEHPVLKDRLEKIGSYVLMLQEGDPDNEDPKKILDQIEEYLGGIFPTEKLLQWKK